MEQGGIAIHGELWQVDHMCLQQLDLEEGVHEQLFSRKPIELDLPLDKDVSHASPEAYFYLPAVANFIDCGNCWTERLTS